MKTKNNCCILFIIICAFFLNSCGQELALQEEVWEHFDNSFEAIRLVASSFNKTLSDENNISHVPDDETSGDMRDSFTIIVDDNSYIRVSLQYRIIKHDPERGEETIVLSYYIEPDSPDAPADCADFDIEFFTALIHATSRKDVTEEMLKEFLSAPEDEYPASRYGFYKLNGERVAKTKYLNRWSDWALVFWGLDYYEKRDSSLELHYFGPLACGTGDG